MLATVTGLVAAGTGAAVSDVATDVDPSPDQTQYPPEQEPTILVDTLTPTCIEGVAYLDYGVTVTGTAAETVTLTWHNPTGDDVVMTGLPLRGLALWPGAYPERFVDLPAEDGWELVNNMWQNTRDFGWAVGTLDVTFEANPEVTTSVTFPQDTSRCLPARPASNPSPAPSAPTVPTAGDLPQTGAEAIPLLAVALGLVLVGGGTVALAVVWRRRV